MEPKEPKTRLSRKIWLEADNDWHTTGYCYHCNGWRTIALCHCEDIFTKVAPESVIEEITNCRDFWRLCCDGCGKSLVNPEFIVTTPIEKLAKRFQ